MNAEDMLEALPIDSAESDALLRHWRWLIPESFQLLCVTKLGDAFLQAADQSIWWLDVGSAEFEPVAQDRSDWLGRLQDSGILNQWSGRVLVKNLEQHGLRLAPGQCFTYLQCPILGGDYEPSNFMLVTIQEHFNIWGPIHEQLRDLPDGTEVEFEVVD